MSKIDRRVHYILVVDTETANTLTRPDGRLDMSNVLVYDCGWAVIDKSGNVYEEASFVNRDIFCDERDLMRSAYYANKIPRYIEDIRNGSRVMASTYEIKRAMLDVIDKYHIDTIAAYNARFDYSALNITQRYVTASRFRYWFPYGLEIWDILKMARDVIHNMPSYQAFCKEHNLYNANGGLSATAENIWRFISDNPEFQESHTGLEDVHIESRILAYCFRQKKPMRKKLWENDMPNVPLTDFQRNLSKSLREVPVISI